MGIIYHVNEIIGHADWIICCHVGIIDHTDGMKLSGVLTKISTVLMKLSTSQIELSATSRKLLNDLTGLLRSVGIIYHFNEIIGHVDWIICCHVVIIDHTDWIIDHTDGIIDHPDVIIGCVGDIIDHVHELIDSTADIFNDFIESYPHGSWKLPTKMLRYFPYFSWRDPLCIG